MASNDKNIQDAKADKQGVLYRHDVRQLVCCDNKTLTHYAIKEGTIVISEKAFADCDCLEEIASGMFSECENLETISLPESIVSIGSSAFFKCTKLKTMSFPNSVTSIGDSAFYGCTSLTECVLSPNTTHIGDFAFSDCKNLTHLSLPYGLTHVGAFAFLRCDKLPTIKIPRSVSFIGECAFRRCQPHNIQLEEGNNAYCVVDDVLYTKDMTTLVEYLNLSQGGTFFVPSSVSTIGKGAFEGSSLNSIILPSGVTHIGGSAFAFCSDLNSVVLSQALTSIGSDCFAYCWRLKSIVSLSPTPPKVDEYFFEVIGCDGEEETDKFYSCTLYVPKGCVKAYTSADEWREFENIEEIE